MRIKINQKYKYIWHGHESIWQVIEIDSSHRMNIVCIDSGNSSFIEGKIEDNPNNWCSIDDFKSQIKRGILILLNEGKSELIATMTG